MYPITVYIGIFDLKFMLFGLRGALQGSSRVQNDPGTS